LDQSAGLGSNKNARLPEGRNFATTLVASGLTATDDIAVISAFEQNEAMHEAEILEKLHRLQVTDSHLE